MSLNVNGCYLNNLRFSDDIILIGTSKEEITRMILDLSKESTKIGLKININKSTILCNLSDENINVKFGEQTISCKSETIYLGQLIQFKKKKTSQEIKRRIALAWKKYWLLKFIF